MNVSLNHFKRYKEISLLLWKYGRSDLVKQMDAESQVDAVEVKNPADGPALPEQLADDLEAMGPTYVKLGQMLSGRPDLLPEPYVKALARLQDNVKPFPYEEVEQIVLRELGTKISKAFSSFNPKPIAAASLGQVHAAALRDGRPVVVKVQRPGIQQQIAEDFVVLKQIAEFFDAHTQVGRRHRFCGMLEEFRLSIQNEMNYEREAQNLIALGKNLESFDRIVVPQPVSDYTTRNMLTMDYIQGRKITAIGPLTRLELRDEPLAEDLFKAYLQQVLVDGLYHADPHPGNVFLTDDGNIALLDLGMVGHVTRGMQENLLKLLMAISEGQGEQAAELVMRISETTEAFNQAEFTRSVCLMLAGMQDQGLEKINIGKSVLSMSENAASNGLFVPAELTLLGKTLLQLDEVGKILDPEFDPNAAIRRNVSELVAQHTGKSASQANAFSSMLEIKHFVRGLPARLNMIMDAVANHEIEVKVKAVDAKLMMAGLQKVANRITTGVILGALIVGASLMMRIPSSFQLFGYPGLAILCFTTAAAGGFWLVISIFIQDQEKKHSAA